VRLITGGTIGDGLALACVGGVVDEIAPVRNPWMFDPSDDPPPSIYANSRFNPLAGASVSLLGNPPDWALPMTAHQRLYQWPDVGPVNYSRARYGKSAAPVEIASRDQDWPMPETLAPLGYDGAAIFGADLERVVVQPRPEIMQMEGKSLWSVRTELPVTMLMRRGVLMQDSGIVRYTIDGVTRNGAGAALAGCTVTLFDAGELAVGWNPDAMADPVAATTVSDGAGQFHFEVRTPGNYQMQAYLSGSPDLAGVTVNTVHPVAV
jgi:hypothetical protein